MCIFINIHLFVLSIVDEKKHKLGDAQPQFTPQSASLLNSNIWADAGGDDFNLEYMDLDEFLSETGLLDTNFANMMAQNPLPQQPSDNSPPQTTSPVRQVCIQSSNCYWETVKFMNTSSTRLLMHSFFTESY